MDIDEAGALNGNSNGDMAQTHNGDVGMVGAEPGVTTPGQPHPRMEPEEEDGKGNRSPPQAATNYWIEEERVREMLAKCYDAGILLTGWDIGELSKEGSKACFVLNRSLDEIKVRWLKECTVTVIFLEGSKNLPKKMKEDVIRAFEDIWLAEQRFDSSITRGRVCNVLSYVAKDKRVAEWMLEEEFSVALKRRWYNIAFKPWLTKVEIEEAKKEVDRTYFWIRFIDVPIDAFCYLESAAEASIGPVIKVYPPESNARTPRLINVRMDIAIESIARLKEMLEFTTFQGQVIKLQVANASTQWCSNCRRYFHLADQCPRARRRRSGSPAVVLPAECPPARTPATEDLNLTPNLSLHIHVTDRARHPAMREAGRLQRIHRLEGGTIPRTKERSAQGARVLPRMEREWGLARKEDPIPSEWKALLAPEGLDPPGTWYVGPLPNGTQSFWKLLHYTQDGIRVFENWVQNPSAGELSHISQDNCQPPPGAVLDQVRMEEIWDEEEHHVVKRISNQTLRSCKLDPGGWGWRGRGRKGSGKMNAAAVGDLGDSSDDYHSAASASVGASSRSTRTEAADSEANVDNKRTDNRGDIPESLASVVRVVNLPVTSTGRQLVMIGGGGDDDFSDSRNEGRICIVGDRADVDEQTSGEDAQWSSISLTKSTSSSSYIASSLPMSEVRYVCHDTDECSKDVTSKPLAEVLTHQTEICELSKVCVCDSLEALSSPTKGLVSCPHLRSTASIFLPQREVSGMCDDSASSQTPLVETMDSADVHAFTEAEVCDSLEASSVPRMNQPASSSCVVFPLVSHLLAFSPPAPLVSSSISSGGIVPRPGSRSPSSSMSSSVSSSSSSSSSFWESQTWSLSNSRLPGLLNRKPPVLVSLKELSLSPPSCGARLRRQLEAGGNMILQSRVSFSSSDLHTSTSSSSSSVSVPQSPVSPLSFAFDFMPQGDDCASPRSMPKDDRAPASAHRGVEDRLSNGFGSWDISGVADFGEEQEQAASEPFQDDDHRSAGGSTSDGREGHASDAEVSSDSDAHSEASFTGWANRSTRDGAEEEVADNNDCSPAGSLRAAQCMELDEWYTLSLSPDAGVRSPALDCRRRIYPACRRLGTPTRLPDAAGHGAGSLPNGDWICSSIVLSPLRCSSELESEKSTPGFKCGAHRQAACSIARAVVDTGKKRDCPEGQGETCRAGPFGRFGFVSLAETIQKSGKGMEEEEVSSMEKPYDSEDMFEIGLVERGEVVDQACSCAYRYGETVKNTETKRAGENALVWKHEPQEVTHSPEVRREKRSRSSSSSGYCSLSCFTSLSNQMVVYQVKGQTREGDRSTCASWDGDDEASCEDLGYSLKGTSEDSAKQPAEGHGLEGAVSEEPPPTGGGEDEHVGNTVLEKDDAKCKEKTENSMLFRVLSPSAASCLDAAACLIDGACSNGKKSGGRVHHHSMYSSNGIGDMVLGKGVCLPKSGLCIPSVAGDGSLHVEGDETASSCEMEGGSWGAVRPVWRMKENQRYVSSSWDLESVSDEEEVDVEEAREGDGGCDEGEVRALSRLSGGFDTKPNKRVDKGEHCGVSRYSREFIFFSNPVYVIEDQVIGELDEDDRDGSACLSCSMDSTCSVARSRVEVMDAREEVAGSIEGPITDGETARMAFVSSLTTCHLGEGVGGAADNWGTQTDGKGNGGGNDKQGLDESELEERGDRSWEGEKEEESVLSLGVTTFTADKQSVASPSCSAEVSSTASSTSFSFHVSVRSPAESVDSAHSSDFGNAVVENGNLGGLRNSEEGTESADAKWVAYDNGLFLAKREDMGDSGGSGGTSGANCEVERAADEAEQRSAGGHDNRQRRPPCGAGALRLGLNGRWERVEDLPTGEEDELDCWRLMQWNDLEASNSVEGGVHASAPYAENRKLVADAVDAKPSAREARGAWLYDDPWKQQQQQHQQRFTLTSAEDHCADDDVVEMGEGSLWEDEADEADMDAGSRSSEVPQTYVESCIPCAGGESPVRVAGRQRKDQHMTWWKNNSCAAAAAEAEARLGTRHSLTRGGDAYGTRWGGLSMGRRWTAPFCDTLVGGINPLFRAKCEGEVDWH
ncbi:hypothetical protein CBR_g44578 [Chara braunii]|uniref:Uncharacterized protein n=1 Tax=Chara braunii TaxID=69332 RepID=A0A388LXY8_CHABU|nr:hypothetical protein CBR_g44578 [Chara braunii]|eukprot:GBG87121.1 hypothetical protein CBR_g44578 [Chara braunii]